MLSLRQSLILTFARGLSITGRSTRAEYWWFMLVTAILIFAGTFLLLFLAYGLNQPSFGALSTIFLCLLILLLVVGSCWITALFYCLFVRRLHDRDLPEWLLVLTLVPGVNFIVMIVIGVLPSSKQPNRHGVCPVDNIMGHYTYYINASNYPVQGGAAFDPQQGFASQQANTEFTGFYFEPGQPLNPMEGAGNQFNPNAGTNGPQGAPAQNAAATAANPANPAAFNQAAQGTQGMAPQTAPYGNFQGAGAQSQYMQAPNGQKPMPAGAPTRQPNAQGRSAQNEQAGSNKQPNHAYPAAPLNPQDLAHLPKINKN